MYKKILIATDGSDTATEAARYGTGLAKALGAPTVVLHVGEAAKGEKILAKAKADLGVTDTMTVEGDAAEKILDVAEEIGADLIIVGNKGMTGARRFLLGSVPNQVSHHAPCNVLIVKTT